MKNDNIFYNAKFGDRFLTRDGRKAVVIDDTSDEFIELHINGFGKWIYLRSRNGLTKLPGFEHYDIVSKNKVLIDEVKLIKLAKDTVNAYGAWNLNDEVDYEDAIEIYKEAYSQGVIDYGI